MRALHVDFHHQAGDRLPVPQQDNPLRIGETVHVRDDDTDTYRATLTSSPP